MGWVGFGLVWIWVSLLLDKCPQGFNKKNVHEMSPKKCPRKVTQKGDISWTKLSTRCHQKCPRNVTPSVHEMSPIMSTKCLPPLLCLGWRHFVDSDISWTLFFKVGDFSWTLSKGDISWTLFFKMGDISWTILVKLFSARLG